MLPFFPPFHEFGNWNLENAPPTCVWSIPTHTLRDGKHRSILNCCPSKLPRILSASRLFIPSSSRMNASNHKLIWHIRTQYGHWGPKFELNLFGKLNLRASSPSGIVSFHLGKLGCQNLGLASEDQGLQMDLFCSIIYWWDQLWRPFSNRNERASCTCARGGRVCFIDRGQRWALFALVSWLLKGHFATPSVSSLVRFWFPLVLSLLRLFLWYASFAHVESAAAAQWISPSTS